MTVNGNWNIVISTPMGDKAGVLALTEDGATMSGSLTNEFGEIAIEDGEVDGAHLYWRVQATQPMPMTLTFDVDVAGDALSGTVKFGPLGEAPVKGTRA